MGGPSALSRLHDEASHSAKDVRFGSKGDLRSRTARLPQGDAEGRGSDEEVTTFDSTGLAIQDLAIALAALERADELGLPSLEL